VVTHLGAEAAAKNNKGTNKNTGILTRQVSQRANICRKTKNEESAKTLDLLVYMSKSTQTLVRQSDLVIRKKTEYPHVPKIGGNQYPKGYSTTRP
jgi:hypothetical protein